MTIYKVKDYGEMSRKAADVIAAQVILKPDCVLGLATGSSPEGMYKELVRRYEEGVLDFSKVTTVNLDEYKGLAPQHEQSYRRFMDSNLFDHVNIDKSRTFVPNGLAEDSEQECRDYEQLLVRQGRQDIQLLGIGNNGHIGFNEPGDCFLCDTHCVALAPSTIEANKRFFASEADVPRYAYSMGIRSIMRAKKILLVASGEAKSNALKEALYGPVTPQVPGSILQLHPDVVVVADAAAGSKLP